MYVYRWEITGPGPRAAASFVRFAPPSPERLPRRPPGLQDRPRWFPDGLRGLEGAITAPGERPRGPPDGS